VLVAAAAAEDEEEEEEEEEEEQDAAAADADDALYLTADESWRLAACAAISREGAATKA
jgi:hypothetical protein